ncbi:M23 family metallopeptidase [Aquibacillus salsiterrae]|uniref:M23 family metallopeptidase n=1 Tax=Aquibacillus salsiterrae TaxID=2950439 RepID=A0A9X3WEN8_9BACI|nr:M23 family metallopeptidase [Aquibacillus salsiterrae]MDC3415666.1 M23 family metallopeptidase [Aquibacillus salsiterrae]
MRRDISQIRKNIARRKRERALPSSHSASDKKSFLPSSFPQDEEKHGYMPVTETNSSTDNMKDTFITSFVMKSILAAVLFFSVAIFFRLEGNWLEQPRQWASQAFTEEFPFASVNQWYQQKFGSPLALTPKNDEVESDSPVLPVNGTVSQTFQNSGEGIMISTPENTEVKSVQQGTVIFAGNDPKTKKTVIIQHPDKSKTIYGNLTSINVYQYQFVGKNQSIGEFVPSEANAQNVYFAMERNNQYVDPVKVMKVDERP